MVNFSADVVVGILTLIVTIELAQLGVLTSTWLRSRKNNRRIRALLRSIGIDPDDPPTFEIDDDHVAADGGSRE